MITHLNLIHNSNEKTSVLFWLRKNKPSQKTGLLPLYCRLTIGGTRANDFSTGIQLKEENWETKTQTILPINPTPHEAEQAELHNLTLQRIKLDLQKIVANFELAGKEYEPQDVVDIFLQKPEKSPRTLQDVRQFWKERLQAQIDLNEKVQNTLDSYELYNEAIIGYFGKKPLKNFVTDDYEALRLHIRSKKVTRGATKGQNTSQNYTAKILQQFKSLFRLAYNKKWIAENPFDKETVETTKTKKSFLPTDKLKALHALVLDSESQKATDIFLFMAYTGLNYQDYAALTQQASLKTHEGKAFIYIPYRQKSPIAKRYGEAYIPILPEVQALIDKYGGIDHLPKDEEANEKLKYVWGKIDAPKDMQLRHARHTYINYLRNEYGLKESTIALIVGHRSTRTTEESYLHKDINTLFKDLQRANL